jgi:hypothetical protein
MWELRHTLLALGAAISLLGCGDSGQTGSAQCIGETPACACWLLDRFGPTVVTATVSEVNEAAGTVVLDVDNVERPSTIPGSGAPPEPIESAPPGWHVASSYQQIDLARAKDHASCGAPPAPAIGERVRAGFGMRSAGFSCPGCVRDMDCDVFCPALGAAATLYVVDGVRLLPVADSYDFAGTVLSRGNVSSMTPDECSSLFPELPAPMCGSDIVSTSDDGGGCALSPAGGGGACWYALALLLAAMRRRRRQGTH